MTETRPDPKHFHSANSNDYETMLDGLAEAIWNELDPTGEQAARDPSTARPYIIFLWVDDLDDRDGFQVRAAVGDFEDDEDDELLDRIEPDFYITSYDDESLGQIRQDLDEIMAEHFIATTLMAMKTMMKMMTNGKTMSGVRATRSQSCRSWGRAGKR
ncbi:hypothetical protein [Paracoccus benzoatiresistens]|uniref:Uncharacterized protein n=1 Tax=Paracoccus benzoatiresistens TaxID=2997341 RepID=A0ABT4JAX0_9RHOB|nr:hypothetical protein [Paracoccus sp. EF6]MCZ0964246.1 hypothetical protein [Paracoccus sp. EF6]